MANLQLPLNQDHEVLGSEYCSGYEDAVGKWNSGFYCPASDESQDVFCCGTEYHKYCCTKKDQVIQSQVQDLTVWIGVMVGASCAILILTMVSCFCCSCCALYKKRNPSSSSMYRLHNTSDHSGVTNMYSLSNAGGNGSSRANTPVLQNRSNHQQYLFDTGGGGGGDQVNLMQQFNGGGAPIVPSNGGLSHSYTLPHNLSHHQHQHQHGHGGGGTLKGSQQQQYNPQHHRMHHTLQRHAHHRNDNPDLIASTQLPYNSRHHHHHHQQQQQVYLHQEQLPYDQTNQIQPTHEGIVPREYGTLVGRGLHHRHHHQRGGGAEPAYQDLQQLQPHLVYFSNDDLDQPEVATTSASNDLLDNGHGRDHTALASISQAVSTGNTTAVTNSNNMVVVSPSQQRLQDPNDAEDEEQFQSTKF